LGNFDASKVKSESLKELKIPEKWEKVSKNDWKNQNSEK